MRKVEVDLDNKVVIECFFREIVCEATRVTTDNKPDASKGALFLVSMQNNDTSMKIPVIVFDNVEKNIMGVYPYPGEQVKIYGQLWNINIDGKPHLGIKLERIAKQTKIRYTGGHCYDENGDVIKWWEKFWDKAAGK